MITLIDCGDFNPLEDQAKAQETIEQMTSEGQNGLASPFGSGDVAGDAQKIVKAVAKARSKAESGIASFAESS